MYIVFLNGVKYSKQVDDIFTWCHTWTNELAYANNLVAKKIAIINLKLHKIKI